MASVNLPIGTKVVLRESIGWTRHGSIFEHGKGRNKGRIRVKWSRKVAPGGELVVVDTKRTWVAADRLKVESLADLIRQNRGR